MPTLDFKIFLRVLFKQNENMKHKTDMITYFYNISLNVLRPTSFITYNFRLSTPHLFFFIFSFFSSFSWHLIFFHFWSKFSSFFFFFWLYCDNFIFWQQEYLVHFLVHVLLWCIRKRSIDFWLHYWLLTISLPLK